MLFILEFSFFPFPSEILLIPLNQLGACSFYEVLLDFPHPYFPSQNWGL